MGFGQGLSGLRAASQNLDVIGNNIANSGTVGFKSGSVSFADVYASSRVGLGVKVAGINQRFTVGSVTTTGGEYDIAIDGAKGFFRLADSSGNIVYSRNGEFGIDKDFFITNALGYRLTGYPAGGVGTDPVALSVPQGNIAPQVSSTASTQTNLNANADVVPATPAFDPTNSATYTDSVPTTIYDSLGNAHQMVQYFVKRAASPTGESQYDVYYTVDGKAVTVDGGLDHTTLTFNSAGVLTGGNPTRDIAIPNPGGTTSPADDMTIQMSYQNVTQFGSDFSPRSRPTAMPAVSSRVFRSPRTAPSWPSTPTAKPRPWAPSRWPISTTWAVSSRWATMPGPRPASRARPRWASPAPTAWRPWSARRWRRPTWT